MSSMISASLWAVSPRVSVGSTMAQMEHRGQTGRRVTPTIEALRGEEAEPMTRASPHKWTLLHVTLAAMQIGDIFDKRSEPFVLDAAGG